MYIFRWLMKHPIIILAVYFLSIAAILYSMTRGGSTDNAVDTAQVTEVQKVESAELDLTNAPTIEPSTLTSALVTGEVAEEITEEPSKDQAIPETVVEEAVETESSNTAEAEIEEETLAVATDTSLEIPALDSQAQFGEVDTDELLLMAREAYWNNGLEESAQIYKQLISANPDVVDYKGELGNVYWRQGFPKKAAELYAEISMPMIADGQKDKVANMVGFIGLFYPEKATEIHNKLQADQ